MRGGEFSGVGVGTVVASVARRCRVVCAWTAVSVYLAVVSIPVVADPLSCGGGDRLRVTVVSGVAAGENATVAVRWPIGDGEALLDIWVDLDGDGVWSERAERLVVSVPLVEEIQVFTIPIPADARINCGTRLRLRVSELAGAACEKVVLMTASSCAWSGGFDFADLRDEVFAVEVFDDGSGPALYVGGAFVDVGPERISRIARWDGTGWAALEGPAGSGTSGSVYDLAVFDDGSGEVLYVGGTFSAAGGRPVNNIAVWDGATWSALPGTGNVGVNDRVTSLLVHDDGHGPALFVGGGFTAAGGVAGFNHIAKWDGSEWSQLSGSMGTGLGGNVTDLARYDEGNGPVLFVTGSFVRVAGLDASFIVRWDGAEWSPLDGSTTGEGLDAPGRTLVVHDNGDGPALYVGGGFGKAGGSLDIKRVAGWDGSDWFGLTPWPNHLDDVVYSLEVFDAGGGPELYAGGVFTGNMNGAQAMSRVARYDGTRWVPVEGSSADGTDKRVWVLEALDLGDGEVLWVGGTFRLAGGLPANYLAAWDGSSWGSLHPSPGGGFDGNVNAFAVYDDGSGPVLIAGGEFTEASGRRLSNIARWDGSEWMALSGSSGNGTNNTVHALAVFNDGDVEELYVGGQFSTAGGLTVNRIAKWDGSDWSALSGPSGIGTNDDVSAFAVFDDGGGEDLYVGGGFDTAGGLTVNGIARWDGTEWSALTGSSGTGTSHSVNTLVVYDDGTGAALYAGGSFDTAGGVNANHVAKWNGTEWFGLYGPLAVGTSHVVRTLAVFDDGGGSDLYAGGYFEEAGGAQVFKIARWDGSEWSALIGPYGPGMNDDVISMLVHDDGGGMALFVGGEFTIAGGVTVNHVARWDGAGFAVVNGPPNPGVEPGSGVRAFSVYDDGGGNALFAGGSFTEAGGTASMGIGKLRCLPLGALFFDGFESGDTSAWSNP